MEIEDKLKGSGDKILNPPDTIAFDELAVKYYIEIIQMLKEVNILSNLDRYEIAQMADSLSKIQKTNEDLQDNGLLLPIVTKNGEERMVTNPSYGIHKDSSAQFQKLATQFGLTPSSRATLADLALSQQSNESDPINQLLGSDNN